MKIEMTTKEKRFGFFCQSSRKKSGNQTHNAHICNSHKPTRKPKFSKEGYHANTEKKL